MHFVNQSGLKEYRQCHPNQQSQNHHLHSYKARGIYVDQIRKWREYFRKDRFLFIESGEFYSRAERVYRRTLRFLDLPDHRLGEYGKFNPGGKYSRMKPETREQLVEYFRPHNARLFKYLGVRYDWDK